MVFLYRIFYVFNVGRMYNAMPVSTMFIENAKYSAQKKKT